MTENINTPADVAPVTFWVRTGDTMIELPRAAESVTEALLRQAGKARKRVVSYSKPVRVVAVNEAKVAEHQEAHGRARPVEVGQTFPSALAASRHLGYASNTVASQLAAARLLRNKMLMEYGPCEQFDTPIRVALRGVTFEFADAP